MKNRKSFHLQLKFTDPSRADSNGSDGPDTAISNIIIFDNKSQILSISMADIVNFDRNLIWNSNRCRRGKYAIFCGYFHMEFHARMDMIDKK